MKSKKLLPVLAFAVFSQSALSNDYVTYIGGLKAETYKEVSVLKFENISINLPVLISGLIASKALPPSTANVLKKFAFDRIQPLKVKEIKITFKGQTRYIELSEAQNDAIIWKKILFVNSPDKNEIVIDNLLLTSPVLKQIYISPISVKSLKITTSIEGVEIVGGPIELLGGSIENFKVVSKNGTVKVSFSNLKGLKLKEALKLANYFATVPIKVEGNLSVDEINIDISPKESPKILVKNLYLEQPEGGIELSNLGLNGEGLFLEGVIDGFSVKLPSGELFVDGNFEKGKFYRNRFSLAVDFNNISTSLRGKFNLNLKSADFVIDKLGLTILPSKVQKEEKKEESKGGLDLEKIVVKLPSLPMDFSLLVKKFELNPKLNIPKVKLKPVEVNDIYLSYKGGIYTAHASVCYTDIFLNADTEGNTSLGVFSLNNPLSAILGCFIKDIENPYLKKFFFNGRINLALSASIPEGKVSNLSGIYQLSLYKGFVFVRKDLQIEGALGRVYNAMRSIFSFLGIDYPTLEYNLYSAGTFYAQGNTFKFDTASYLLAQKPVNITFAGLVGGFYNLQRSLGSLNVRGFTKLPFKRIGIRKTVKLGSSK